MHILLVGSGKDPHIQAVYNKLKDLGSDVIIFDRYDKQHRLTWNTSKNILEGFLKGNKEEYVPFREIKVVWWRFKGKRLSEKQSLESLRSMSFENMEWREAFTSLPHYLRNAFWANDYWEQNYISRKIVQLQIAKEIGFNIPQTSITNDQKQVTPLFEEGGKVIYKTLSSPRLSREKMVFTTQITFDQVERSEENIKKCPGIYQKFVDKDYELRITVIGYKIFSVKIKVDPKSDAYIDWKKAKPQDIYEIAILDPCLESLIRKFHSKTRLVLATYDIIRSTDGQYYFLECNPAGQWLWIEEKLNLPITDTLCEFLHQKCKN